MLTLIYFTYRWINSRGTLLDCLVLLCLPANSQRKDLLFADWNISVLLYLRGRQAAWMVAKIRNKDDVNFVNIILGCSCHLTSHGPNYVWWIMPVLPRIKYCIVKKFWMIFAEWFRLFSSAPHTKHSFSKRYLISGAVAAVRCEVLSDCQGPAPVRM